MTTLTPTIAWPDILFPPARHATRYATSMPKKHDDPLYTVARYTTAQVAEMLGIKRVAVQAAIRRGQLDSELPSPNLRLVSQAAIDMYRADHLGQVGKPSNKKRRLTQKAEATKAARDTDAQATAQTSAGAGRNAPMTPTRGGDR